MPNLMAVDLGTTHLKVGIFDGHGVQRALAIAPNVLASMSADTGFYEPDRLWDSFAAMCRQAIGGLKAPAGLSAVCVTGMAEAGLPLDEAGRPLYPIMPWFDTRTKPQAERWQALIDPAYFFHLTGLAPHWMYSVHKIVWLREHEPDIYASSRHWLNVPDYFGFLLTGETVTSYSLASRTGLFDLARLDWSHELTAAAQIDPELLPRPLPSGRILGTVARWAAEATGIPQGIPVVIGGHDHLCGAFGAGVKKPGAIFDSSGTAETFLVPFNLDGFSGWDTAMRQGFTIGCHVLAGRHYLLGPMDCSGGCIEWLKRTIWQELHGREGKTSDAFYARFMELAGASPAGARGLVFLAHLRGGASPQRDLKSRGAFIGLTPGHTCGDLFRAVLEGLSYEAKGVIDAMAALIGYKIGEIVCVGGGTRNHLWQQIKASVNGRAVLVPAVGEGTLLGAALLAGIGAGIYKNEDEALAVVERSFTVYQPGSAEVEFYRKYCDQIYNRLYDTAHETNELLYNMPIDRCI